jgi:DNA-binding MarR family transcriptional regulator
VLDEIRDHIKTHYRVFFSTNAIYGKLAKKHGLTACSLFVLHVIYEYPEQCTQRLICEKLLYPKQTVNAILDSFEEKKYIKREAVPGDRRSKHIVLTPTGRSYADGVLSDMFQLEESALLNLEPELRKAMLQGELAFYEQLQRLLE